MTPNRRKKRRPPPRLARPGAKRYGGTDFTRLASEVWSGRRGSNPRPTAWKAVTLPLSYSRPLNRPRHPTPHHSQPWQWSAFARLRRVAASARLRRDRLRSLRERSLVARGGFEPPKPLGRQIYSLLHLTALQPRQTSCQFRPTGSTGRRLPRETTPPPAPSRWSWRRDLNPRPADYKSAALPD